MGFSIFFLICSVGFAIYKGFIEKKIEKEIAIDNEEKRKVELKQLIENREERISSKEFDENEFWKMIEKAQDRSKNSYKNHLGVLKDYLYKMKPEELIELDNLLLRLYKESISYDLFAAATIIFKSQDISSVYLLLNIFITRGEVFFKQASLNPNLIIGKIIEDIESIIINDLIDEVYFNKTKKLIPTTSLQTEFNIKGEPWKEKDLPSRYSDLWMAFA